jgi:uncharacterized protein YybS (DUF2232 family)
VYVQGCNKCLGELTWLIFAHVLHILTLNVPNQGFFLRLQIPANEVFTVSLLSFVCLILFRLDKMFVTNSICFGTFYFKQICVFECGLSLLCYYYIPIYMELTFESWLTSKCTRRR